MKKINVAELFVLELGQGFLVREVVGLDAPLTTSTVSLAHFSLESGRSFAAHTHRHSHEIYVGISGRAEISLNGETIEVAASDAVLFKPGDVHAGKAIGGEPYVYWAITTPAYHPDDHIAADNHGDSSVSPE